MDLRCPTGRQIVGRPRIVALVIIQHGFEIGAAKRLHVLGLGGGIGDPARQSFGGEFRRGVRLLEIARVLAILLLLRIVGEFAQQAARLVGEVVA